MRVMVSVSEGDAYKMMQEVVCVLLGDEGIVMPGGVGMEGGTGDGGRREEILWWGSSGM